MTYTYVILDVSPAVYDEIRAKLAEAGYQHAFHQDRQGEVIDMHDIALRRFEKDAYVALSDWRGQDQVHRIAERQTKNT